LFGVWNVSAPTLGNDCRAVASTASSITFQWSSAFSAVSVTYYLADGTTVKNSSTTTSAAVIGLEAAKNYSFSLFASTANQTSSSNSIVCSGWTGKPLRFLCVIAVKTTTSSQKFLRETDVGRRRCRQSVGSHQSRFESVCRVLSLGRQLELMHSRRTRTRSAAEPHVTTVWEC
jgi:hypothetical protein